MAARHLEDSFARSPRPGTAGTAGTAGSDGPCRTQGQPVQADSQGSRGTAQARLSPERRISSAGRVESVSATGEQFAEEGVAVLDPVAQSRCGYFRTATRWQDAEAHYRGSTCDQGAHPNREGSSAVKWLNERRIPRPNGVAYHAIRCLFRRLARFVRGMVVRRFRSRGRRRLEQRAGGAQKYAGNNGKRCSQRGRPTQAKLSEPLAPI
jgi:hypothetical protein